MVRFAGLALGVVLAAWPWLGEAQSYPPTKAGLQRLVAADEAFLPAADGARLQAKYDDWVKGIGVRCDDFPNRPQYCFPEAKDEINDIEAHVFRANRFVIDSAEWSDTIPAATDENGEPNSTPVVLSLIIPQIVSPTSEAADAFNKAVRQFSDQLWSGLGGPPRSAPATDTFKDVQIDYDHIEDPRLGIVTITFTWSFYSHGAAHGEFGAKDLNWDVRRGRALEVGDLFDLKTDWKHGLAEAGLTAFQNEQPYYFENLTADDLVTTFCDPHAWAVTEAGLRIDTQAYEVGGYAAGAPSAVVPWAVLRPYLRRGGLGLGG